MFGQFSTICVCFTFKNSIELQNFFMLFYVIRKKANVLIFALKKSRKFQFVFMFSK